MAKTSTLYTPLKPPPALERPIPPTIPQKYFELPAGLMYLKVPTGTKYYDPIPVSSFTSLPPPQSVPNMTQILNDFYKGLDEQKQIANIASTDLPTFEETEKEGSKAAIAKKFDGAGWEPESIDEILQDRRAKRVENLAFEGNEGSFSNSDSESSRSSSDSEDDSRRSKRRRSPSPEGNWRTREREYGYGGGGYAVPAPAPVFSGFQSMMPGSEDSYDAFRTSRSYTFDKMRRNAEPGACFRCGK
ncbi:UNVERIFIED_CONTAM: hypothetical protein HDU68_003858, partial [Siphonaria sp. JEL0065]